MCLEELIQENVHPTNYISRINVERKQSKMFLTIYLMKKKARNLQYEFPNKKGSPSKIMRKTQAHHKI